MHSTRTPIALLGVALIAACATASQPAGTPAATAKADEHAAHHPAGAASAAPEGTAMHDRMKAMREMHDRMMNAKTPEERQALMAEHMKTMQDGMQMMKGMGGGMEAKGMPADMAQRQKMLEARMDMMQAMMDMMMQRMPAAGAAPAAK